MDKTYSAACFTERICTVRICASLVYRNEIIQTKSNTKKSHPFQKRHSTKEDAIFLHAENNCIVSAIRSGFDVDKLKYCSLYVARAVLLDKVNYSPAYVKPCIGCQSAIATYGIKNVYYTTCEGIEYL